MVSIAAEAQSGDRLKTLIAMRDKLAADMDEAPPAVVAQIAGRLSAILGEIEQLGTGKKVTGLDELEQRRKDRIAAAEPVESARRQTRERRPRSS